ncbi:hypothetical protein N7470_003370 [Penicillium chermesinum]|nr:hypothetical protein N7470_003370 [Penicillium chermesinum]
MAPEIPNDIVLYWYPFSPYAYRIYWYLLLRGIKFASCIQPHMLPRPDLKALNVEYRRIPILSIGKDIYLDSRHILSKLETLFPGKLLDRWTTNGSVFGIAAQMIPADSPAMRDPKFIKDRNDGGMKILAGEARKRMRPEAIVAMRDCFDILENTILADGRMWVFGGNRPSLGDIEALWPFAWVMGMPGALPDAISAKTFPRVFSWASRFNAVIKDIKSAQSVSVDIKGKDVVEYMESAQYAEPSANVDENDPLGLSRGELVEVYPTDYGFSHKDRGKLLTLTPYEAVITKQLNSGTEFRVHVPRWGYRITKVKEGGDLAKI